MERKDTPIETSLIQRVSGALKYAITGVTPNDWFGPNQPITPVAQDQAVGRLQDYEVGQNMRTTPRQSEGTTYNDLRALADSHDLTRLCIETKKDQIARLKWEIRYKDGKEPDKTIDELKALFERPMRGISHSRWLRMLLEDALVLDAVAIYPQMNRGGKVMGLSLINAATINRMIDINGHTPLAPSPAYQQILKGVPAVDYSEAELYYSNRNPRTHKLYGFSPVEQIILTVNMALRRQASQLDYFSSGTVPDAIMESPEGWTAEHIAQFQLYWDSILSGNTAERRKARFVPHGANYKETKTELLKDEFDEWLAKIVAYAFSVSPQALIKTMNRASAEVSTGTAQEEGLLPWKEYLKEIHDDLIRFYIGADGIEFVWVEETTIDALKQAQIDQIYITSGVYTPQMVQERMGIKVTEVKELEPPQISEKIAKADDTVSNKNDEAVTAQSEVLAVTLGKQLADIGENIATDVTAENYATIDLVPYFKEFIDSIIESDKEIMKEAITQALGDLGVTAGDAFDIANKEAEIWAEERGAELVGMKWDGTKFIENPNAKWAITETTRDAIRRKVQAAIEGEMNQAELRASLIADHAFSESRAKMIAITETNTAWNSGSLSAWRASGMVEGKKSILGTNENHGEDDIANAGQGVIPIDQPFQSGHMGPSYHPHCFCSLVGVLKTNKE